MLAAYSVFFVMLVTASFCSWQVLQEVHELRNKTPFEKNQDKMQKEIEKYKGMFRKLK